MIYDDRGVAFKKMEKGSSSSSSSSINGSPAKKGRAAVVQPPRCQVEGCLVDLSGSKAYYCRHKVCGMHSKSPMVIVAGLEQRFCQQCSRFQMFCLFFKIQFFWLCGVWETHVMHNLAFVRDKIMWSVLIIDSVCCFWRSWGCDCDCDCASFALGLMLFLLWCGSPSSFSLSGHYWLWFCGTLVFIMWIHRRTKKNGILKWKLCSSMYNYFGLDLLLVLVISFNVN